MSASEFSDMEIGLTRKVKGILPNFINHIPSDVNDTTLNVCESAIPGEVILNKHSQ